MMLRFLLLFLLVVCTVGLRLGSHEETLLLTRKDDAAKAGYNEITEQYDNIWDDTIEVGGSSVQDSCVSLLKGLGGIAMDALGPFGSILKVLLGAFWPSSGEDIWSLLVAEITELVDLEIFKYEVNQRASDFVDLKHAMSRYASYPSEVLLEIMTDKASLLLTDMLRSPNKTQLMPMVSVLSVMHMFILKERQVFYTSKDPTAMTMVNQEIDDTISSYYDFYHDTVSTWKSWREGKLETSYGVMREIKCQKGGTTKDNLKGLEFNYYCDFSPRTCPSDDFYSTTVEKMKQRIINGAETKMAQWVSPVYDFGRIFDPDASVKTVIPGFQTLKLGPFCTATADLKTTWGRVHSHFPTESETSIDIHGGDNGQIIVYSGFIIDYISNGDVGEGHGSSGEGAGGSSHEIPLTKNGSPSVAFKLRFDDKDNFSCEDDPGILDLFNVKYADGTWSQSSDLGVSGDLVFLASWPESYRVQKLILTKGSYNGYDGIGSIEIHLTTREYIPKPTTQYIPGIPTTPQHLSISSFFLG